MATKFYLDRRGWRDIPFIHSQVAPSRIGDKDKGHARVNHDLDSASIVLHSSWRKRIRMSGLRKVTVLKYILSAWQYRSLSYLEKELLILLMKDFSTQEPWGMLYSFLLQHVPPNGEYHIWLGELHKRRIFAKLPVSWEEEDIRHWMEFTIRKYTFGPRSLKGVISSLLSRARHLFSDFHRRSEGIFLKRSRKRGHNDHGSLPLDPIRNKANSEGGELEFLVQPYRSVIGYYRALDPPAYQ